MNYYDKYLKYKLKYLENKKNKNVSTISNKLNNYKLNKNNLIYQKAGTSVLYVLSNYVRTEMDLLKLNEKKYIIEESVRLNKYYHRYYDINQILRTEGIDLGSGPDDNFKIEDYVDNVEVDVDMYESYLIYDYLVKINRNLKIFGIETVQSQTSYYVNDVEFFNSDYFQNPFLSFSGNSESIPVLKKMMEHDLAKDLLFFSHYDSRPGKGELNKKTFITFAKPVFNDKGEFIFTFDDKDFWDKMEQISLDMNTNYSVQKLPMFEGNDPDLDGFKDWYVLNDDYEVVKIDDKTKPNPYSLNDLPLTTLNVRYTQDINEFAKVYS
jgi:hypothetical protein